MWSATSVTVSNSAWEPPAAFCPSISSFDGQAFSRW
jgi:hypothetical protein